jgi:hypothetical protein
MKYLAFVLTIGAMLVSSAALRAQTTTTTDCTSNVYGANCTTTAPGAMPSTTNCSSNVYGMSCTTMNPNGPATTTDCSRSVYGASCTSTTPPSAADLEAQQRAHQAEIQNEARGAIVIGRGIARLFHHAPKPTPPAYVPQPYQAYHEPPPDLMRDDNGDSALVSHIPSRYIALDGRLEPVFGVGLFHDGGIVRGQIVIDCHTRRTAAFSSTSALLDRDLAAGEWTATASDSLSAGLQHRFCNATD